MFKKPVIITAIALVSIFAAIFIYRYQIMQYTAEMLIRKCLPDYIKIDTIKFDFAKGDVFFDGVKVLNPPEFSKEYMVEIEKITCHYKMRGKTILDGLELSSPVFVNAFLNAERLGNGKVNLAEEGAVIEKKSPAVSPGKETAAQSGTASASATSPLPGVKFPETFIIKDSKAVFIDRMTRANPNIITFENVNAEVTIKMDAAYKKVLTVSSVGQGNVNGDKKQIVNWTVNWNPTTPRLTMSNRFEVSGVSITPFEPYYDKYSPLVFKTGRFSGLLIFDFNNGMIGSSDELRLSDLRFFVKSGYENTQFWETTVPDLVKYFTTPYGEIVFDFKIKGDMENPKFYLGPKSKEAIISMAVDKISAAIQNNAASASSGAPKNDIDKAKQYIDLFKNLMKK